MSMSNPNNRNYDPNIIIKAANEKLAINNDVAGGQMLFQSGLLDWVDDAREHHVDPSSSVSIESMREAIATLWIAYAQFLIKAKQYKSATEAYENAVECPVSGGVGRIWLEYARFLEDRDKLRTAQQVYLRALHDNGGGAVRDEQDQALLWNEFLEMMRKKNPDLTLQELKQAISEERSTPEPVASTTDTNITATGEPAAKRPRTDNGGDAAAESKTHVVTAADVNTEAQALQDLTATANNDPSWKAAWMVRDGDQPPQPPLSLFQAAPPKLSDPTGKDLLGEDLALGLVRRLLQPDGAVVLQIARGLWMLTAIKQHESQKTLQKLDDTVREEWKKLEARLDERLSVAGAAEAAVRTMNETEQQAFQANCNQQRVTVVSGIAWDFRVLLWQQQQFFSKLKIPGLERITVDEAELEYQARVCSYLHSAFFLRQRIGEKAHVSMLKSQQERLQQLVEEATANGGGEPRVFPPASSSTLRQQPPQYHSAPPQYAGIPPPPPPPPISGYGYQQQQHQQPPQPYNMTYPQPPQNLYYQQ